jgi:predicted nucleic acid-binding protein
MKSDILVDTSAWIDYFNKPESETGRTVEQLLRTGKAALAGIVLTEILQGAKIKTEFDAILESMLALPLLESSLTTWIEAGRISFALRKKGITIPTTDLIIASLVLENNCSILTLDPHFQKIPGVKIY